MSRSRVCAGSPGRIQQLVRLVEAREQPALRERWRDDARGLLDRIAGALQSVG